MIWFESARVLWFFWPRSVEVHLVAIVVCHDRNTQMQRRKQCKGENNYKNLHYDKRKLERQGVLTKNVTVEQSVIDEAVTYLNDESTNVGEAFEYLDTTEE